MALAIPPPAPVTSATFRLSGCSAGIPRHKLVLIDDYKVDLGGDFTEVYQDFEDDIYQALKKGREKIIRYQKLVIAYPSRSIYP